MKKIKVYGERNSGTHFIEHLVETYTYNQLIRVEPSKLDYFLLKTIKFDVIQDYVFSRKKKEVFGWKHGCPPIDVIRRTSDEYKPVFISVTKNPYSFLISLFEKPYHYKGVVSESFSDFIRTKWICRGRDGVVPRTLDNPIMLWNIKNEAFLKLSSLSNVLAYNFTYEELLQNPLTLKEKLKKNPGIKLNDLEKVDFGMVVKSGEKGFDYYQDYYLNERWKGRLSEEDIEYINSKLNESVMKSFGYSKLS